MNLNKLLCKYLDTENVGYVTVGRVFEFFICLLIMAVFVVGSLYSIYQGYLLIITGGIFNPIVSIDGVLGGIAIIIASGIVTLLIGVTIVVVGGIKIAKCEYKKDE